MALAVIFAKYAAYLGLQKVYGFGQALLWLLNGTYISLWRSRRSGNEDWSGHLLDIIGRYKLYACLEPSGPINFITTHHGFVSPSYILQDNVTLYTLSTTEAVFVETEEHVDVTHSGNGSFLYLSQFENAKRIIILPIPAFHKLAEELGDPQGTLVFLTNTSRCGSTLLSQVYEQSGRCLSLSEPGALNIISTYRGKKPQDELDTLIRNSIRIQCKPMRDRSVDAYILKLARPLLEAVPMFLRIFPQSKQLFMYREGLKVAQSIVRSSTQMPLQALKLISTRVHPRLTEMAIEAMGLYAKDLRIKLPSPLSFSILMWANHCRMYLEFHKKGYNINAIKYEDLVKHPRESTTAIFEYSNLPLDLVEESIKALQKDSQRHSPLSMKNLSKAKNLDLVGEDKVTSDVICDKLELPRIPKQCDLEGTITVYKERNNI